MLAMVSCVGLADTRPRNAVARNASVVPLSPQSARYRV